MFREDHRLGHDGCTVSRRLYLQEGHGMAYGLARTFPGLSPMPQSGFESHSGLEFSGTSIWHLSCLSFWCIIPWHTCFLFTFIGGSLQSLTCTKKKKKEKKKRLCHCQFVQPSFPCLPRGRHTSVLHEIRIAATWACVLATVRCSTHNLRQKQCITAGKNTSSS